MVSVSETALSGMAEICAYVRRSEKSVLDLIRYSEFPATKIGGIWESDKLMVDEWRRRRIVMDERGGHPRDRIR